MTKLAAAIVIALIPTHIFAFDSDALTQLKETKRCEDCDLSGGDFRWAGVFGAELGGAENLVDGVLNQSNLSGANFYGANLEGTKLRDANLSGSNLSWSSLIGADLTGADLTDATTTGAIFCGTIMPDGVKNNANC